MLIATVAVVLPLKNAAAADTCTWVGGLLDNIWNTFNWNCITNVPEVPKNGDSLVFPDNLSADKKTTNNDLNLSVDSIQFSGAQNGNYILNGNTVEFGGPSAVPFLRFGSGDNTVNLSLNFPTDDSYISSSSPGNVINGDVAVSSSGTQFALFIYGHGGTLAFGPDAVMSGGSSGPAGEDFVISDGGFGFLGRIDSSTSDWTIQAKRVLVDLDTFGCRANRCLGDAGNPVEVGLNGAIELATAGINVANPVTFTGNDINGNLRTAFGIGTVTYGGTVTLAADGSLFADMGSTMNLTNTIELNGHTLYFIGEGDSLVTSGTINGAGGIVGLGFGTQTFLGGKCGGASFDVLTGTIAIDSVFFSSCEILINGGAFQGTGFVGPVTGNTGSFHAGVPSMPNGALSVNGDMVLSPGLTFHEELNGINPGGYDQTTVLGDVNLGDASLDVTLLNFFSPSIGDTFTILIAAGGITGTFAGLPNGSNFVDDRGTYRINYNLDPNGNDSVTLTVLDVSPLVELCANGIDDDGDDLIDCQDADCTAEPACVSNAETCENGVDDDGDSLSDCGDPDCNADPACAGAIEICDNGVNDDEDDLVDCDDPNCTANTACAPVSEICDNGRDDDGDGTVDCDDPDCDAVSACLNGEPDGGGGCSLVTPTSSPIAANR